MSRPTCAGTTRHGKPCGRAPLSEGSYCAQHQAQRPLTPQEAATLEAAQRTIALIEPELLKRLPPGRARRYVRVLTEGATSSPEMAEILAGPATLPDDQAAVWVSVLASWLEQQYPSLSEEDAANPPGELLAAIMTDLPKALELPTFEEVRVLAEGIAHGRGGQYWKRNDDGTMREFKPRPKGHVVRLRVHNAPADWGSTPQGALLLSKQLDATLAEWNLDAAFLALIAVGTLADGAKKHAASVAAGVVTPVADLKVDELLDAMGKEQFRNLDERNKWRRWVRVRLLEISGASVVGTRKGKYRDPHTKEVIDTAQEEALFHIIDAETTWEGGQLPLDPSSGNPIRMRIHAGGLFRELAKNPKMLQRLGDLRVLAAIPSGRPAGQWARSIGLAFAQLTREQAGQPRPRTRFTRRELLTRFPPSPSAEEILDSPNPKRALEYWEQAKAFLVREGWCLNFEEPPLPSKRKGWGKEWLDQELEPPPGPVLAEPLPELAAKAQDVRARRRKRRVKQGAGAGSPA